MKLKNVSFKNSKGHELTGRLELPADQDPHNFAIFAHCFTCSKNLKTTVTISRELAQQGFGVLRFDFTGLGDSEGDFSDTNFSGNIEDLIKAADFLKENYKAPSLLVGHSLGGAATIFAADKIQSIKAVATIAAPADPEHVTRLLRESEEEILEKGEATVNLQGRDFTIKKQFLDDLRNRSLSEVAHNFGKALLILHSPQDKIVGIKNAEDIYKSARHPKSYVSLDGANHLLTDDADAHYTGKLIGEWAMRYVNIPEKEKVRSQSQTAASLDGNQGFTTKMKLGNHYFLADEPKKVGGDDYGPTPYDYLAGALAACKAMTVQMYAKRKKWSVKNVTVNVDHSREHPEDFRHSEDKSSKIDTFKCEIQLEGNLDEKQRQRLLEIADRCPVHRTLSSKMQILSRLVTD